ncbi:aminotransferase [Paracoccus sp. TK19116]|uniref:aspartate transaminase n=1 Tax=Paracoccus albicereus TaxID=2922394 RepID=A0ABT1MRL7_9RHOB|nr:aminotransferase [Paracoccus albicereus]MCQ0970369.1 aminotransferase [Paracoccus albicereus]
MSSFNPAVAATFSPPVMEARRWLADITFAPDRPLINVSQAAPVDPPPEPLRRAIAEAALHRDEAHLYGPVLGNADLREALAETWSQAYAAPVEPGQIAITQGCNQAFCAAIATLAQAGDEVILPVPWYFNHKMWLDMAGVRTVPLACDEAMLPDLERAATLIGPRTRALVLVTPNNPTGAEYPPDLVRRAFDLCQRHGIALVVDETYRDFHSAAQPGVTPPHNLLSLQGAGDTLIQLYSFSKAYRLTGHRVGAVVASTRRMVEVEKWLDTVAISTGQLGQIGAVYGLRNLSDWLASERLEILARRRAAEAAFEGLDGWTLKSCGAYFAWVAHPFKDTSAEIAPRLVREAGVLALPGTMFMPDDDENGAGHFRFAFANVDADGITHLADRLRSFAG